jgi:transposase
MLVELSVVEQRYHAVMEVLSAGAPKTEVAQRYGVSRKTVHEWVRKYEVGGLAGLADRSHRPHHHPWQIGAEVEAAICELRRNHPRWGPRRLGHELARTGISPVPSRSSIYRTHPATGRTIIYLACSPTGDTDPTLAAPREVAEVQWVGMDELDELMPDLYKPAREHLAALLGDDTPHADR